MYDWGFVFSYPKRSMDSDFEAGHAISNVGKRIYSQINLKKTLRGAVLSRLLSCSTILILHRKKSCVIITV